MTATSKPPPGSPAALLDVVVRSVTEGRYRMAHLHLLWHIDRVDPLELGRLVDAAGTVPDLPPAVVAADVVARGRPALLPRWLAPVVDAEIARICAGLPLATTTPTQIVGRLAAAICVDVSADLAEAAVRAADPDASHQPSRRGRMIHLDLPDDIRLGPDDLTDSGPSTGPGPGLAR